jgi:hypothetical protein
MGNLGRGSGADETQSVAGATEHVEPDVWEPYWRRVNQALVEIFWVPQDKAHEIIDRLQRDLDDEREKGASISDVALYHLDPLQVAADLAGTSRPLSAEQKQKYVKILAIAENEASPSGADLAREVPDDILV